MTTQEKQARLAEITAIIEDHGAAVNAAHFGRPHDASKLMDSRVIRELLYEQFNLRLELETKE